MTLHVQFLEVTTFEGLYEHRGSGNFFFFADVHFLKYSAFFNTNVICSADVVGECSVPTLPFIHIVSNKKYNTKK